MKRSNAEWLAQSIANQGFDASAGVYTGGGIVDGEWAGIPVHSDNQVWAVKCDIGSALQAVLEMLSEDFDTPPEKFGSLEVITHIGDGTYIY